MPVAKVISPIGARVRASSASPRFLRAALAQARYLCKRLRASFPHQKIVVIRWGLPDNAEQRREELLAAGADLVATTLLEARAQITPVVPDLAHVQEAGALC